MSQFTFWWNTSELDGPSNILVSNLKLTTPRFRQKKVTSQTRQMVSVTAEIRMQLVWLWFPCSILYTILSIITPMFYCNKPEGKETSSMGAWNSDGLSWPELDRHLWWSWWRDLQTLADFLKNRSFWGLPQPTLLVVGFLCSWEIQKMQ